MGTMTSINYIEKESAKNMYKRFELLRTIHDKLSPKHHNIAMDFINEFNLDIPLLEDWFGNNLESYYNYLIESMIDFHIKKYPEDKDYYKIIEDLDKYLNKKENLKLFSSLTDFDSIKIIYVDYNTFIPYSEIKDFEEQIGKNVYLGIDSIFILEEENIKQFCEFFKLSYLEKYIKETKQKNIDVINDYFLVVYYS